MIDEEVLKGLLGVEKAIETYNSAKSEGDLAEFCRRFMYNSDQKVASNALWALTKASDQDHKQLQPLLHQLIDLAMQSHSSAVRRLALNNIERLEFGEEDLRTDFLDFCLDHMIDPEEFPGVQSLCMKLAYNMCTFYPELMGELRRSLESMDLDYYTPAVKSVRLRILNNKRLIPKRKLK